MANCEHVAKLKEGVEAWNQWRLAFPYIKPDLRYAILRGADLYQANLCGADLRNADLSDADLRSAVLIEAELNGADLSSAVLVDADLRGAYLDHANLSRAYLRYANLSGAYLSFAFLNDVALDGANFARCSLDSTLFGAVDLNRVSGIETVQHIANSSIGTDTLAITLRGAGGSFTDDQRFFFQEAGVPPTLLEYLPSIFQSNPIQFYTCFISYSTADEAFATRLNEDLNNAGVHTWKWDLNAVAGRDLRANIDGAIRHYDKIILVCSADSLTSGPVEREIERALQKEDRLKAAHAERAKESLQKGQEPPFKDTDVLVPIRIDDTVFHWPSQFAADVKRRYIPDFTGKTERRSPAYKAEVEKLIQALKPNAWPPNGVGLPQLPLP